jgi:hypothetical protein
VSLAPSSNDCLPTGLEPRCCFCCLAAPLDSARCHQGNTAAARIPP